MAKSCEFQLWMWIMEKCEFWKIQIMEKCEFFEQMEKMWIFWTNGKNVKFEKCELWKKVNLKKKM